MIRRLAGIAVLLAMAAIGVLLLPPYFENWKLQEYLNGLAADPAAAQLAPAILQANIVNKAAQLGLPVRSADVHVSRDSGALRVEVLYLIHVDLAVYSVDLHFRPAA